MGAPPPPKKPAVPPPDVAPQPDDTQPISRFALDAVEANAEGGALPDPTDTMSRAALFGGSSPDTEPNLRVAQAIDLEVRATGRESRTMAPVRASKIGHAVVPLPTPPLAITRFPSGDPTNSSV